MFAVGYQINGPQARSGIGKHLTHGLGGIDAKNFALLGVAHGPIIPRNSPNFSFQLEGVGCANVGFRGPGIQGNDKGFAKRVVAFGV